MSQTRQAVNIAEQASNWPLRYQLLREEFPQHSPVVISRTMIQNRQNLFLAYLALQGMAAPGERASFERMREIFDLKSYVPYKNVPGDPDDAIRQELYESRLYYVHQEYLKYGQRCKEAEKKNFEYSKEHGLLRECECCFANFPLNRMVSCSGDPHHVSAHAEC